VAYIFFNGLFNNAVNSAEFTAMNGRMISESVVGKDVEGTGYSLS
jgi:hypothetical protein